MSQDMNNNGAELTAQEKRFKNRKDMIKNFAIIFLVIMLILTFFSNTIMNYSLPQVAVQYVTGGQITAKVRGSGTVESGTPYDVMVKQTRKVEGIHVKVGDVVSKDAVLLDLAEAASEEVVAAQEAVDSAEKAYDDALLNADLTESAISGSKTPLSAANYRKKITAAQAAVKDAKIKQKAAKKAVDDLQYQIDLLGVEVVENSAELIAVYNATIEYNKAKNALTEANNLVTYLENQIKYYTEVSSNNSLVKKLKKQLVEALAKQLQAEKWEADAALALQRAQDALDAVKDAINTDSSTGALSRQLIILTRALNDADEYLAEKEEELSTLVADINGKFNLNGLYEEWVKAMEKLEQLQGDELSTQVLAPISGTISAINVTLGQNTDTSEAVIVMQPEGQAYTLSFSVTNEQAKRIAVGDIGEPVNSYWYNDLTATVASIKPDQNDPNKSKTVTFNIDGDVTAGQSITLSVGQKSANYDLIVPTSAIREDNNGKFILIVTSKSTPLGNRYTATRYDVEVLSSDDSQSAISAALYGYEYVITTSTKPINPGDMVRMSET